MSDGMRVIECVRIPKSFRATATTLGIVGPTVTLYEQRKLTSVLGIGNRVVFVRGLYRDGVRYPLGAEVIYNYNHCGTCQVQRYTIALDLGNQHCRISTYSCHPFPEVWSEDAILNLVRSNDLSPVIDNRFPNLLMDKNKKKWLGSLG